MNENKYTQKELKDVLKRHKAWIKGSLEGEKANLSGADLSGMELEQWVSLYDADLTGINLSRAHLVGVDFELANLRGANLTYANFTAANLGYADLRDADLSWADLTKANLHGADLRYANLRRAQLTNANLYGARLDGANLNYANLVGAVLADVSIKYADFRHTDPWRSSWPLSYDGSMQVRVDRELAAALAAHFCSLDCDDPDYITARDGLLWFARTCKYAGLMGLIESDE